MKSRGRKETDASDSKAFTTENQDKDNSKPIVGANEGRQSAITWLSRRPGTAGSRVWDIGLKLIVLTVALGAILRVVMIIMTGPTELALTFWQYAGAFAIGAVNDAAFATLSLIFIMIYCLTAGNWKYGRVSRWVVLGVLCCSGAYVAWLSPWLREFNAGLWRVLSIVMLYWVVTFGLRVFVPRMRRGWTRVWMAVILFIYVGVALLNSVGEYFFWNEFAVRYNFIAVDYLVYTSEVIGNILESYPIVPLSLMLLAVTGVLTWALFRRDIRKSDDLYAGGRKWLAALVYTAAAGLATAWLALSASWQQSENVYYNELQANGPVRFFDAFMKNRLDYKKFYITLPDGEAAAIVRGIYGSEGRNERTIATDSIVSTPNIVLITMESMSADYMERFGNKAGLTPNLDSLYRRSVAFDRMIACGNRTVRGLEALTLSIPPSAGQSLIKRPEQKERRSIGSVLRERGYRTMFFYGGKSYFDNMGPFFAGNGYEVIDKDSYKPEEIKFSNIWGVCDEDSYDRMLTDLDATAREGKPFFAHMMTISNHRPYTYPEGRIAIPPTSKSREGGVMYADYALGRFMRMAARKPWFDNTVFVIVADHCASSAGGTELPLEKYHIPALIYAPRLFAPRTVEQTVSQIDIMPTLLSMLGMGYRSTFYGTDVLSESYQPRAFLATYQDLGYLQGDTLTVLSPVKRVRQFVIAPTEENKLHTVAAETVDSALVRRAAAMYQTAAEWTD